MPTLTISIEDQTIELETGKIARQASSAVVVRHLDTVVLVTVQSDLDSKNNPGFFPLTVEYREKAASVGKLPGGFLKREGRITDHEVLTCRLIDRSIRPLFPKSFRADTQVIATVLSADPQSDPGVLAMLGASAALHLSEIPWSGPAAGIRVSRVDGDLKALASHKQRETAEMDFVVASGPFGMSMVEGNAQDIPDAEVLEALFYADDLMKPVREALDSWRDECGKPKREAPVDESIEEIVPKIESQVQAPLREALTTPTKLERKEKVKQARASLLEASMAQAFGEDLDENSEDLLKKAFDAIQQKIVRRMITEEKTRIDGRGLEDIRSIETQVSWLPCTHGSSIFTRGETQALVSCTLSPVEEAQRLDNLFSEERRTFILHYNFPPYSVGETRPLRGPGRREVGHGSLARTALAQMMPSTQDFSYTVRLESDITESNGSSSMATVCGGCLALMDAGVPLRKPVAGIAMGLVQEGEQIAVLSDILGDEDHLGDMDFKVTGTHDGVTAMQMDNKIGGLSREVMEKALTQALNGRRHILGKMAETLKEPRPDISERAPRVTSMRIRPDRIAELIGPKGSVIQDLQARTQTRITVDDSGQVSIFSTDPSRSREALKSVKQIVGDPEVGRLYRGSVVSVKPFGAFVRIIGKAEGLVHVSELAEGHVEDAASVAKPGDEMIVRVLGVDKGGRLKLSRKEALDRKGEDIEG